MKAAWPHGRKTRMARRSFMRLAGWTAAALGISGVSWLFRPVVRRSLRDRLAEQHPFAVYVSGPLRPPGAVEESLFRRLCTGCCLCGEVCPVKAIRFVKGTGLAAVTPLVIPRTRGCILCMRCTQVCPTRALEPMEEEQASKVRPALLSVR
jgi:ferredoxin